MSPQLFDFIAIIIGYVALIALVVCVLGSGYLCAYEICKAVGSRIFFPIWAWHIMTTIACVKASKTNRKEMYISCLFNVLEKAEQRHPDMKGLLDRYAELRMSKSL